MDIPSITEKQIAIIGLGGVGTYLLPVLIKTLPRDSDILLVDGDKFESKNLDRQLFPSQYIGINKAEALVRAYPSANLTAIPRYIGGGLVLPPKIPLFCCVDNHPARLHLLNLADSAHHPVFVGANEFNSAQSYFYVSNFKGTKADPRVRFPDMLQNTQGDRHKPSCAQEQVNNRQLAIFNQAAANYMSQLFWLHFAEGKRLPKKVRKEFAIQHSCNFNLQKTIKLKEVLDENS